MFHRWAAAAAASMTAAVSAAVIPFSAPAAAAPAAAPQCATGRDAYRGAAPWPQTRLQLARSWAMSTGGGVPVAVVATGVDAKVPQLQGRVGAGATVGGGGGGGGSARTDCDGRGTFAAGIVAAKPDRSTSFTGVAPDARIIPVRYTQLLSDDKESGGAAELAGGIEAATRLGAKVIVVVTAQAQDTPALKQAVRDALAADAVVVSAGARPQSNNNQPAGPTFPTAYRGVLSVTGVDANGAPLDEADRGRHILVAAPGKDLVGTVPGGGHSSGVASPGMAAAYVGGVAALVRAYRPDLKGPEVVQRIRDTATPLVAGGSGVGVGAGLVDPYAALSVGTPASDRPAPPALAPVGAAQAPDTTPSGRTVRANILVGAAVGAVLVAALVLMIRRRQARPGGGVSAGST